MVNDRIRGQVSSLDDVARDILICLWRLGHIGFLCSHMDVHLGE